MHRHRHTLTCSCGYVVWCCGGDVWCACVCCTDEENGKRSIRRNGVYDEIYLYWKHKFSIENGAEKNLNEMETYFTFFFSLSRCDFFSTSFLTRLTFYSFSLAQLFHMTIFDFSTIKYFVILSCPTAQRVSNAKSQNDGIVYLRMKFNAKKSNSTTFNE